MRISFFNYILITITVLLLTGVSFSGCGPAEEEETFRTHPDYGKREPLSPDEDRLATFPDYLPDFDEREPLSPYEEPPRFSYEAAYVSDENLKRAAEAHAEIEQINREMHMLLQQPKSPEDIHNLQSETNRKIVQAIEQTGIDFDEYNRIMEQVNTNREVEERFQHILRSTFK